MHGFFDAASVTCRAVGVGDSDEEGGNDSGGDDDYDIKTTQEESSESESDGDFTVAEIARGMGKKRQKKTRGPGVKVGGF